MRLVGNRSGVDWNAPAFGAPANGDRGPMRWRPLRSSIGFCYVTLGASPSQMRFSSLVFPK